MMILVTGGSGSGKSAFAEDCVLALGEKKRIYIATMFPFDEESKKRVARHRNMRKGKGFETVECYAGLKNVRIRTVRSSWNVCPILWQTKCFRNPVPEKIQ